MGSNGGGKELSIGVSKCSLWVEIMNVWFKTTSTCGTLRGYLESGVITTCSKRPNHTVSELH